MARQYIVPGRGYVNADGTKEYIVPKTGYVNIDEAGGGGPTYTLSATTGSFTFTGGSVGLITGRKLSAATGAYTLTGNTTNLVYTPISGPTYTLIAETGTFILTGGDSGLKAGRKLSAATGSFILTGSSAALLASRKISAVTGSFGITGATTGLIAARKLSAGTGVFTLTGYPVTLTLGGGAYQGNKNIHIDSVGGMVLQLGTTRIPFWNTSRRPSAPTDGTIGFNSETVALEVYDGSTWKTVTLT